MNTVENYITIHLRLKLDRFAGSCNSLNDLPNKVCVSNKAECLNIHVFNIIIGKSELKIL